MRTLPVQLAFSIALFFATTLPASVSSKEVDGAPSRDSPTLQSVATIKQVETVDLRVPFKRSQNPTGSEQEFPVRVFQHGARVSRVALDLGPLFAEAGSAALFRREANFSFEPFEGEQHYYVGEKTDGAGAEVWVGRLDDPRNVGTLILSKSGDVVYGIAEVGLERYIIEANPRDGAFVWEVDHSTEFECATSGKPSLSSHSAHDREAAKPQRAPASAKYGGTHDVDVFFYYTGDVLANYVDPAALANVLAASMNVGFGDSGVTGAVNVVGYRYINTTNAATFQEFQDKRDSISLGSSEWSGVADLRNDLGADVVVLLVEPDPQSQQTCGAAQLLYDGDYSSPIPTSAYNFSAVVDIDCAGASLTFTHEVGHVLGGQHDVFYLSYDCGLFDTSCGYTNSSASFRTVMGAGPFGGTNCTMPNCPRINRFSNEAKQVTISGTPYDLGTTGEEQFEITLRKV